MGAENLEEQFLRPGKGASPYLACWHRAFAPCPGREGPRVSLWCDRGPDRPLCERIQLPPRPDDQALRLAALYLAALINNKLCVWGARRLSLVAEDPGLGQALRERVAQLLFARAEAFSDLTPLCIYALLEQRYGQPLVLDTDPDQARRLAAYPQAHPPAPTPAPWPPGRHTVVSLNIGQHKTACALVCLDGAGSYSVSRLWRRETWSSDRPRSLPDLAGELLADLACRLGPLPPEVTTVGLSLANPVLDGLARGVDGVGLCAASDPETAGRLDAALRRAVEGAFPGLSLVLLNDAAAQGLFTARYGLAEAAASEDEAGGGGLLSLRFGACPSVSYLDAGGRTLDRVNEYPWLVTTVHANRPGDSLLATISRYLSYHGLGSIAGELGLLAKYGLEPEAAAAFFHRQYTEGDLAGWRDAVAVYRVLGAHIAMLAYEIERDTPVRQVQLLGSTANQLDAAVFGPIWDGFAGFIDRHVLPFASVGFGLTESVSDRASLVGAAVACVDRLAQGQTLTQ